MAGDLIGFTGHQGLTANTEKLVAKAIEVAVRTDTSVTGICSLAEGSDQLFARTVLAAGGDLVVIVPCRGYEQTFASASVLDTFRDLLSKAREVIELDHAEPSEGAFWDAGQQVVVKSDRIIAVWDGKPAGGLGGTADVVGFARQEGKPVEVIWPKTAART